MFHIKRLYTFILQTFIPVFAMTFLICLFIVLMQFLWRYVDEMVGKGLEMSVLGELFLYAALTLVPTALPLAILLASLMTFGNMGERLELLAMKAAGVSLIKIMSPLIILVSMISFGAFFFQEKVMPVAQVKMYTLLYSMRHKSPELDIPEGVFYKEIDGYNIYIKRKNHETGMLYDMMIYDISSSFEDMAVIVADSGKMKMRDDKKALLLTLWSGESFENLKDQRTAKANVPYRRESFSRKDITIEFDANFNRMDESVMSNRYIGKNMNQLQSSIDSLTMRRDSIAGTYSGNLKTYAYFRGSIKDINDSIMQEKKMAIANFDSIYNTLTIRPKQDITNKAMLKAANIKQDYEFKAALQKDEDKEIRRHEIELHRKFTLSFACLIFFFIGAPLGAIIKKGGMGLPVIISVLLFIVYYIIDNIGFKMARDGEMSVFEGIWLSSGILLPMGVFFTYKAVNDSTLFNPEVYIAKVKEVIGLRKKFVFKKKEVIIETLNNNEFKHEVETFNKACLDYLAQAEDPKSISFINFYTNAYTPKGLGDLVTEYNILLDKGSNSDSLVILKQLSEYKQLFKISFSSPATSKTVGLIIACILPLSVPYYILAFVKRKVRIKAIKEIVENNKAMIKTLNNV